MKQGWINGRYSKTHGMTKTKTYKTWGSMKTRCSINSHCRKRYYDKGITVCERWEKFESFLEDMGLKPDGLTLDRKDGDKGYYKENCRWATPSQQQMNRCITNRNKVGYKGVFLTPNRKRFKTFVKLKHIGTYDTPEQAAEAYNDAAVKEFGEYAKLNIIRKGGRG